jgi:hypothetical protein
MVGVDIGKSCHTACFGTQNSILAKKFEFANLKDGFKNFERTIQAHGRLSPSFWPLEKHNVPLFPRSPAC